MKSESIKPIATNTQRAFYAQLLKKSSRVFQEQQNIYSEIKKMEEDIAIATIGYGKAIMIMSDRLEVLRKELKEIQKNSINIGAEFTEKFGVSPYGLDKIY